MAVAGVQIGTGWITIAPSMRGFGPELNKQLGGVENQMEKSGKKSGNIFTNALSTGLGMLGAKAVGKAGELVGKAFSGGFNRYVSLESAELRLKALKFTTEQIDSIMKTANKSVKGTAFGAAEAATAAGSLVNAGIRGNKELEAAMNTLVNTAAVAQSDLNEVGLIFGKIAAKGKMDGETMAQLTERNIPVLKNLAEHLNVTEEQVTKMVRNGEIDFDTFQKAMAAGMDPEAARIMAEGIEGASKNAGAALDRFGQEIWKIIGPSVVKGLDRLIVMTDAAAEAWRNLVAKFRGKDEDGNEVHQPEWVLKTIEVFNTLKRKAKEFGDWWGLFYKGLSGNVDDTPIAPGGTIELGLKFRKAFQELGKSLSELGTSLEPFVESLGTLLDSDTNDGEKVAEMISGIATAISALAKAINALFDPNSFWNKSYALGGGSIFKMLFVNDKSKEDAKKMGEDTVAGYREGIEQGAEKEKPAILKIFLTKENGGYGITAKIAEALGISSPSTVARDFGLFFMQGFSGGLSAGLPDVLKKVTEFFEGGVIATIKRILGISSPSKVTHAFGVDTMRGWMNGIDSLFGPAMNQISRFVEGIRTTWSRLQGYLTEPVRNGVNIAIDILNSLIKAYNVIAESVGVKTIATLDRVAKSDPTFSGGGSAMMGQFFKGGATPNVGDRKPAGIVHGNEHVWTAKEVRAFPGGHAGLYKLREAALAKRLDGRIPGFFLGGAVPAPGARVSRHPHPYYSSRWAGDLAAPMGAPINAWKDGIVAWTKHQATSYGNHLLINHANNESSLYAHASRILVKAGDIVKAGMRIALVGSTGNSTGPHLHFEIRGGNSPLGGDTTTAGAAIRDFFGDLKASFTGPLDRLKEIGDSKLGDIIKAIPRKASEAMLEKVKSAAASFTSNLPGLPAGAAIERWRGHVTQALGMAGLPQTPAYVEAWLRQIKSESSGNPANVQSVRDINWPNNKAVGLVQLIPGTFAAYRHKGLPNDRTDPLANLYAGMNYAKNRYGIERMLNVIGRGHGYANGTNYARPGWALVGERGPEIMKLRGGEQILSNAASRNVIGATNNITYSPVLVNEDPERQREEFAWWLVEEAGL